MSAQHPELAAGRWLKMSFLDQMANLGSEVERALIWRSKNPEYSTKAFERALELLDLTLGGCTQAPRLKELARAREVLADFFFGSNEFGSSEKSIHDYFFQFACAARAGR